MLIWESYLQQQESWPSQGRHIMAQFDDESVVVYQAYRPDIGHFAAREGYFGGEFRYSRMSWIKPNFLWMMYRCGWGHKPDQEVVLAVRLRRAGFDTMLARAVHSNFQEAVYPSLEVWKARVAKSEVRLQWDPDHLPDGTPTTRRALQLGLRGQVLAAYGKEWILSIEDISARVQEQFAHLGEGCSKLVTPSERCYPVADPEVASRLGVCQ